MRLLKAMAYATFMTIGLALGMALASASVVAGGVLADWLGLSPVFGSWFGLAAFMFVAFTTVSFLEGGQ